MVAAVPDLVFDEGRVAQRLDLVAVPLEERLHVVADGSIVVDDEDRTAGSSMGKVFLRVWGDAEPDGRTSLNYSRTITDSAEGARGPCSFFLWCPCRGSRAMNGFREALQAARCTCSPGWAASAARAERARYAGTR